MAELIKDTYASQLLVTLAKQLGFEAEPAVINLANDQEFYTLASMHAWLMDKEKQFIQIAYDNGAALFTVDLYLMAKEEILELLQANKPTVMLLENRFYKTYTEALEAGLKHAFHLLIERKKNGELQKPA